MHNKKILHFFIHYLFWLDNNKYFFNTRMFFLFYKNIYFNLQFFKSNFKFKNKDNFNLNRNPNIEGLKTVKNTFSLSYNPKLPNKYVHPVLNSFINYTIQKPFYANILNPNKMLHNYCNIINVMYFILSRNFNIFLIYSFLFREEILSFFKYTFGIRNSSKYSFLINNTNKKIGSFYWKNEMIRFIIKKKIKLFVLFEISGSTELITFLRSTRALIAGLVPTRSFYNSLDYYLFVDERDFITRYLFMSTLISIYNLVFFNRKLNFFKNYNYYFIKLFYNNYKFL